jgi:hypothetical protein
MRIKLKVVGCDKSVCIDSSNYKERSALSFSAIRNMGYGLQVNDYALENAAQRMCVKIANAVYEYIDEAKMLEGDVVK